MPMIEIVNIYIKNIKVPFFVKIKNIILNMDAKVIFDNIYFDGK